MNHHGNISKSVKTPLLFRKTYPNPNDKERYIYESFKSRKEE